MNLKFGVSRNNLTPIPLAGSSPADAHGVAGYLSQRSRFPFAGKTPWCSCFPLANIPSQYAMTILGYPYNYGICSATGYVIIFWNGSLLSPLADVVGTTQLRGSSELFKWQSFWTLTMPWGHGFLRLIKSAVLNHKQVYNFRFHQAKLEHYAGAAF